uniref:Uncharacterized protein n=1 Tax=Nelumbo nucifera TaxID=4432 RepID=A0A822XNQ1_NELNU|nr:TPA_asm: hypothetical protein HUJ06_022142 [Nelumbo nucifera]
MQIGNFEGLSKFFRENEHDLKIVPGNSSEI